MSTKKELEKMFCELKEQATLAGIDTSAWKWEWQPRFPHWTPAEETPEDDGLYLISGWRPEYNERDVICGYYTAGKWYAGMVVLEETHGVTAWMPMPEPYEESDDE